MIALIQAFGMSFTIARQAVVEETFTAYLVIIISLTAGTAFLMWMGGINYRKGIGNGISLIILPELLPGFPPRVSV